MSRYIFFLGQNHPLAKAEVEAIFDAPATQIRQDLLALDFEADPAAEALCRLGGSIKVAKEIDSFDEKTLEDKLYAHALESNTKGFSITHLETKSTKILAEKLKNRLSESRTSRYLVAKEAQGLSPVAIKKQKVTEFFLKDNLIFKTIWIHDFRHWIARDRNRPYVTPKIGMLPPKLARIMVNLGLKGREPNKTTLLDPFCGSGTIPMEARVIGVNVIGSDLAKDQARGTEINLKWIPDDHYCGKKGSYKVLNVDAVHISESLDEKVHTIVTEPSLGPANPRSLRVPNIIRGLHKLYVGSFKDWLNILATDALVVFAYPLFTSDKNRQKTAQSFIDTCENLGYNCLANNLDFTRPGADVFRKILVFQKK